MEATISGRPSFAYVDVDLAPGEAIVAEADAMASMSAGLEMKAKFNGGLISGLCKKLLGGESLFVNEFTNTSGASKRVTLVQATPGDIRQVELNGESLCLQPGAYLCSTPRLKLGVRWAGLASGIGREGLVKLVVSGVGTLWYGAYGALLDKEVKGEYIVDTSHLVAYPPSMKLKVQLAGGLISSVAGGEGLVTRVEGNGAIVIQTRSLSGLRDFINPKL